MSDLDALLAGIVAHPHEHVRWLVMADWLEDHGFPERAELVRVHRELLRTCTDPDAHPDRPQLHARMMELMRAGVQPCLPQKLLTLPGGVELRMSFIPPGSFLMGSPETEAGREEHETLHLVTLTKGFWLGQTPVTQAEWVAVLGNNQTASKGCEFKGAELPVESRPWRDIEAFCAAVKEQTGVAARLPTEAEWEYAARAGTTTPFYWGTELNGHQANCNGIHPYGTEVEGPSLTTTTVVGSYAEVSPHPCCLVDVIGNVWEWCADWDGAYPDGATVDPVGPGNGSPRLCVGGSWRDASSMPHSRAGMVWLRVCRGGSLYNGAANCRAADRRWETPSPDDSDIGFRLAAGLEPVN